MQDFEELAGRIEGVARALMHTVVALEQSGLMNGPALTARLRGPAPEGAAARTLRELAQALDDARSWRQSRARPA